jgi:hypothetical protein
MNASGHPVAAADAVAQRSSDETDAAGEQAQHQERVEQRRPLKVDLQVRDDAREDDDRAGEGQSPAAERTAVVEEQADADEQRHQ